jgi:hypothetical protein
VFAKLEFIIQNFLIIKRTLYAICNVGYGLFAARQKLITSPAISECKADARQGSSDVEICLAAIAQEAVTQATRKPAT